MKEKYFVAKGKFKDCIVFVKSGNFFHCYFGDAVMIHYIMGYKINNNNRVGFPSKVLVKVIKKLRDLRINYILVYELDDIVKCEYQSNSYTFYLQEYLYLDKKEK